MVCLHIAPRPLFLRKYFSKTLIFALFTFERRRSSPVGEFATLNYVWQTGHSVVIWEGILTSRGIKITGKLPIPSHRMTGAYMFIYELMRARKAYYPFMMI